MAVTDYYRLLGVPRDASADDIKARLEDRRHAWMQRQHAPRPEQRTEAERNLGLVPKIKEVLLDQRARKAYDAELRTATPEPTDLGDRPDDADLLSEGWRCVADGQIAAALVGATPVLDRMEFFQESRRDGGDLPPHRRSGGPLPAPLRQRIGR